MPKDTVVGTITGTAGVTFPWWNDFVHTVTGANQVFVAVMGALVLILTAWKMCLDISIARRKLRGPE